MTEKDNDVEASTREKIKEAAQSGVIQLIMPGVMAVGMLFLGYAVNRLSDHFDRIDAHLATADTSTTVLRRDVDELKAIIPAHEAQIKAIAAEADHTAWEMADLQRDRLGHR